MIWGEGIEDVALTGPGLLWARGLQKGGGPLEEAPDPHPLVVLDDVRHATLRSVELTTPAAPGALPAVAGRELAGVTLFASDGHPQPFAPYTP